MGLGHTFKLQISNTRPSTISPPIHIRDDTIRHHGQQVPRASQHEREGVRLGGQVLESLIGIAEKVHHRRAQEHTPSKLGPQRQEPLIPLKKVGRNAPNKSGHEDYYQTPYLRKYQRPRPKVKVFVVWVAVAVAVFVTAVSWDGDDEEDEEEEEAKEEMGARHGGIAGWGRRDIAEIFFKI